MDFTQNPRAPAAKGSAAQTHVLPMIGATPDATVLEFERIVIATRPDTRSRARLRRISDVLAVVLALFLCVIPLPFGANTAPAWLLATGFLAGLTVLYGAAVLWLDPGRPLQIGQHTGVITVALILLGFAWVQTLPLPHGLALQLPQVFPAPLTSDSISLAPDASQLGVVRMLSYLLLFCLMTELAANPQRALTLLRLIFAGIVAHAIWALVALHSLGDVHMFAPKTAYQGYATGAFVNRNSLANYLAMGLVIGLALTVIDPRGQSGKARLGPWLHHRAAEAIGTLMITAALLSTGSRLGLVAAIFGGVTLLLLMRKTRRQGAVARVARRGRGWILLATALLLLGLATRFDATLDRLAFAHVDLDQRRALYTQTLLMIWERPWLGYGLDSFSIVFEAFHAPGLRSDRSWHAPHNTVLTHWAEMGVLLGCLPLVIWGLAATSLWQRRRGAQTPLVVLVALAVIALQSLHAMGDFALEIPANTYVATALIALGLAAHRSKTGDRDV